MKLNKKDKELLSSWGYPEKDFKQIEEATKKTKYKLLKENDEEISQIEAIEILGREIYLNGICRSAFHWSAVRENNGQSVYFDSSRLFKE